MSGNTTLLCDDFWHYQNSVSLIIWILWNCLNNWIVFHGDEKESVVSAMRFTRCQPCCHNSTTILGILLCFRNVCVYDCHSKMRGGANLPKEACRVWRIMFPALLSHRLSNTVHLSLLKIFQNNLASHEAMLVQNYNQPSLQCSKKLPKYYWVCRTEKLYSAPFS